MHLHYSQRHQRINKVCINFQMTFLKLPFVTCSEDYNIEIH